MIFGCPGSQNIKQPHPEIFRCQGCGSEIEIWSDEASVKCSKCGKEFLRPAGQSCLDWCRFAKECVGRDAYDKYKNQKKGGEDG